jgi:hypothetical protein
VAGNFFCLKQGSEYMPEVELTKHQQEMIETIKSLLKMTSVVQEHLMKIQEELRLMGEREMGNAK